MKRRPQPLPETIALAHARASVGMDLSPDAIVARQWAQRLFSALKARPGCEISALLDQGALAVLDPAYDAADRLWNRGIYVEPRPSSIYSHLPPLYLVMWPGGASSAVTETELLEIAGISIAKPA
jgi:hypothetical protein